MSPRLSPRATHCRSICAAGDFLYMPPGAVHRESNPGDEESHIVVARAGSGEPVFNVDGPGDD